MMTANIDNTTRKAVYRRDGFRCALCDSTDGLQVHHIKPRGQGGSRTSPHNLITLCWRCHAAAHGTNMYDFKDDADRNSLMERMELDCIEYVADYYAEQGEIWYPWEG